MDGRLISLVEIKKSYNNAGSRLIILDYDGTLIPREHYPGFTPPSENVIKLLQDLASDPANTVIVISGRSTDSLDDSLLNLPITVAAEHGALYRDSGNSGWIKLFDISAHWIPMALTALKGLAFHYAGSEIEQKEYSLIWHFRKAKEIIPPGDKRQIMSALRSLAVGGEFIVKEHDFFIELKTPGINKGSFISRWVGTRNFDFIMAMGDGYTNEDLFEIFGEDAFTIKVNKAEGSAAKYFITNQQSVVPFITDLMSLSDRVSSDKDILYNQ